MATRRKRSPPKRRVAPRDPKTGRFLSRAQIAARKGWDTRRRRVLEREREIASDKRRAAARKGWETRRRKAREQARLKVETAQRRKETRERKKQAATRRSVAAKLGWQRREQKALQKVFEEQQRERPVRGTVSPALRSLFTDPRWTDSGWHVYEDGSIEGQIVITAGPPGGVRRRFLNLEKAVRPILEGEPVWVQVGVFLRPKDMTPEQRDRYEKYEGVIRHFTWARRAENTAALFLGARETAKNMQEVGYYVAALAVQVTTGERPEKGKETK